MAFNDSLLPAPVSSGFHRVPFQNRRVAPVADGPDVGRVGPPDGVQRAHAAARIDGAADVGPRGAVVVLDEQRVADAGDRMAVADDVHVLRGAPPDAVVGVPVAGVADEGPRARRELRVHGLLADRPAGARPAEPDGIERVAVGAARGGAGRPGRAVPVSEIDVADGPDVAGAGPGDAVVAGARIADGLLVPARPGVLEQRRRVPGADANVGEVPHSPFIAGSDCDVPETSGWVHVAPVNSKVPSSSDAQTSDAMHAVPSQVARAEHMAPGAASLAALAARRARRCPPRHPRHRPFRPPAPPPPFACEPAAPAAPPAPERQPVRRLPPPRHRRQPHRASRRRRSSATARRPAGARAIATPAEPPAPPMPPGKVALPQPPKSTAARIAPMCPRRRRGAASEAGRRHGTRVDSLEVAAVNLARCRSRSGPCRAPTRRWIRP